MKTLARMLSFSAVLATGAAAIAADCNSQSTYVTAAPAAPVRTAYRSAYTSVGTSSTYVAAPSNIHHVYGPETRWEFMRARQHIRGW